jgi:hypothetical protein
MLPLTRRPLHETARCCLTSAEQTARAILYPVVVPGGHFGVRGSVGVRRFTSHAGAAE